MRAQRQMCTNPLSNQVKRLCLHMINGVLGASLLFCFIFNPSEIQTSQPSKQPNILQGSALGSADCTCLAPLQLLGR